METETLKNKIENTTTEIDLNNSSRQGFLYKQTKEGSDWKRKYFVLQGPVIYCFNSKLQAENKVK